MVNYKKSIIYKLCCKDVNIKEIYVGSTCNQLRKRKNKHKSDCNNENSNIYNSYVYKFIRQNSGFENWSMIIIENYPCENKRELEKRERYFMEVLNSTLNSYKPFTTEEEKKEQVKQRYENNKTEIKDYQDKNKDKIKEQQKEYNEKHKKERYNCICGSNIRLVDKKKHFRTTKHLDYIRIYFNILRQNKTIIK